MHIEGVFARWVSTDRFLTGLSKYTLQTELDMGDAMWGTRQNLFRVKKKAQLDSGRMSHCVCSNQ